MAGQWTFPDGVCEQHNIPNKSMRYWPKDIARADRKEQGPAFIPSAYPDFRRVGGQLRPPLANRFRYICPVVSDCAAGPRNWLMYSGSFAMMTSDNV